MRGLTPALLLTGALIGCNSPPPAEPAPEADEVKSGRPQVTIEVRGMT
jgi:hypothetical protein